EDDRWKAATARDRRGWTAEVFIPYESFGFVPIRSVKPNDIIFDMVQSRTVMGFNVHRITRLPGERARWQASSWSRSKGPIPLRDCWNFGQAHFRELPCSLEEVTLEPLGRLHPRLTFKIRSRSDKAEEVKVKTYASWKSPRDATEATTTLKPGETAPMGADFPRAYGRQTVGVKLVRASDGWLMDEARIECFMPSPVQVVLPKTVLYETERDFWAEVKLTSADKKLDDLRYRIAREGKVVVSGKTGPLEGDTFSLPFALSGLTPGSYRFEV
ncbi:unnamed protein product, partial [marine sediment metagenome]